MLLAGEKLKSFLSRIPELPERAAGGHKGSYGTALLIGGSLGMSGAAVLAGSAALTAGAGLVRLLLPEPIQTAVASSRSEYTAIPVKADRRGRIALDAFSQIEKEIKSVSAVGLGHGLGRSAGLDVLVFRLYQSLPVPMVLDADALNTLAAREAFFPPAKRLIFDSLPLLPPAGPRILTPHPGEFARLFGKKIGSDPAERADAAKEFLRTVRSLYGGDAPPIVLLLKGAGTVVTDGESFFVNETGNPGMGTGGSGDVLTGIITAFLAQRFSPFDAAVLGAALHGLAGDLAASAKGEEALTASDLIHFLPEAFRKRGGAYS